MFKPFEQKLKDMQILAITTGKNDEKQFATYCSPDNNVGENVHMKVCMSNLASAIFFRRIDRSDFKKTTWRQLIDDVNSKVTK